MKGRRGFGIFVTSAGGLYEKSGAIISMRIAVFLKIQYNRYIRNAIEERYEMTSAEQREAARQFYQKWANKGKEDEDDRSYWIDILARVMGVEDVTDHIEFQKKVIVDGNTKRIDAYIPETRVLIEQKSLGIALDKKIHQSGGIELTPYEQAKRYNDNLPFDEKARWIVTSNFAEIWIYDMNARVPEPVKLEINDLQAQYSLLDFLIDREAKRVNLEMEISLQAGELVGRIYDAFLKQYKDPESPETLKSLNKLCVRIVFCLYAEDAEIFGKKGMFHDYLSQFDAKSARKGLRELFRVLDQKPEERDAYLADDDPVLAAFPYVNGGLFADEDIEIPPFTDEILNLILRNASDDFDWSKISPTIFGAVFESTLNPETRRSGGMHYTSIENIHKVIDPLFLDDLKAELESIKAVAVRKTKENKLRAFQKKLSELRWLDPACGSGNFLTETYISVRRLENETLKELQQGQITLGYEGLSPIQVTIDQFYGIEINDFAVTVAKTALWIAESQMMKETEDIVLMNLEFLPLTTNANIVEGNALTMKWEDIVAKMELSYIMGNPPFVGAQYMDKLQKETLMQLFKDNKKAGVLDYVSGWYYKAAEYMQGINVKTAFVSTNSITQGEQVAALWKPLFEKFNIHFDYAYQTFQWDSEANMKAHVHCVIIGFSSGISNKTKILFMDNQRIIVENINPYLMDAPTIFVESRKTPICNVPYMTKGCQPTDGGNLIIEDAEIDEFIKKEPGAKKYIKRLVGAREFINNQKRWCLWLVNASPSELRNMPLVMQRVEKVRDMRLNSTDKGTRKLADTPTVFRETYNPKSFIIVPSASSQRRRYIPLGFLGEDTISTNLNLIIPDATLYHFGVLTSNVHMAWVRAVCGRLKSDYRYSKDVVYNNYPWPEYNTDTAEKIQKTAQMILDARSLYPDSSLADLYDPLTMPPELRKAHQANDREVMKAYGFSIRDMSESDCVAALMKMYEEKVQGK